MAVPYLGKMVQHMSDPAQPVAVKRNVVRLLQFIPLPEHLHAAIMNTCFDLLADPKETVAVRAFSMTVLTNLADTYPEIKQELRALIEDQLEQQTSPGFRSRGIKTLSLLQKQPIT